MSTVRVRTMIGLAVSAVTLVVAGTAQAMTLAVGSPELTARIVVTVPVTVTCDQFSPTLTVFSQSISIRVDRRLGARSRGARGKCSARSRHPCCFRATGMLRRFWSASSQTQPARPSTEARQS